jgi:hypothetical protein
MPGVVVTTAVRTGPTGAGVAPASTYFACGTAERGPVTEAGRVSSLSEFEEIYGDYNSNFTLHQNVQTFFEEGGTTVYVGRVANASATAGTLTLVDGGSVSTLSLVAASPGAWSADLGADVDVDGSVFAVRVYYKGVQKYSTGYVANAGIAADKINNSAIARILVSATALQGSSQLASLSLTNFSTGLEGGAVTTNEYLAGLDLFESNFGAGAVAIPGQTSNAIYDGLIAHAKTNNRIALLAIPQGSSVAAAKSKAEEYQNVVGAEYAAFYYPFITIPGVGGISITMSPESYVAAKRSIAHNQIGAWQAGAGLLSRSNFVTGVATSVNKADGDSLDASCVNAIRVIQNSIRIYGARSASSDDANWRYITYRDTINYIVVEAQNSLEDLVFSTIDGRGTVFGRTEARLIGILEPLRAAGGLFEAFDAEGNQIDPGYGVFVTDALNPVTQLAQGLIRARVGVRVSSVGDRIEVEVVKSNLTSSVV